LPPRLLDECVLFLPRPLPLFLPPWSCLLTVAHAICAARFDDAPRFFALLSMWLAVRFCLGVYLDLLPLGMTARPCTCDTKSGTYGAFLTIMGMPPERTGPGQSGAAAGQSYFDERAAGVMPYPIESMPQGSRSTFEAELPVDRPVPSDDVLRELILRSLGDALRGIEVHVHAGAVRLSGAIGGDDAKRELEAELRGVPGVESIDNQLEVNR
jgi:hypothetical protein